MVDIDKEIKKLNKRYTLEDALDVFIGVGGKIRTIASLGKKTGTESIAQLTKVNEAALKEVVKMNGEVVVHGVGAAAGKSKAVHGADASALTNIVNGITRGLSFSILDKAAVNMMQGKLPDKIRALDFKGSAITFFEAFGEDPQFLLKREMAKFVAIQRKNIAVLEKTIPQDIKLLKELRALKASFK